jgi:hypothetical protein
MRGPRNRRTVRRSRHAVSVAIRTTHAPDCWVEVSERANLRDEATNDPLGCYPRVSRREAVPSGSMTAIPRLEGAM